MWRSSEAAGPREDVTSKWVPVKSWVTLFSLVAIAFASQYSRAEALATHVVAEVNSRIESRTSEDLRLWTGWDQTLGIPTLNKGCWAANVDFSFASAAVWREGSWRREGCALLVTPRHITIATHNSYAEGERIRFLNTFGEPVDRTILKITVITGTDVSVGRLDEAIPATSVKPGLLLRPDDVRTHLVNVAPREIRERPPLPLVCLNRDRAATIQVLAQLKERVVLAPPSLAGERAANWVPYFVQPISGTSGCPIAFLIDGRPVLVGHYSTARPETGPWLGSLAPRIDRAIADFGDSERVAFADLGKFESARNPSPVSSR